MKNRPFSADLAGEFHDDVVGFVFFGEFTAVVALYLFIWRPMRTR